MGRKAATSTGTRPAVATRAATAPGRRLPGTARCLGLLLVVLGQVVVLADVAVPVLRPAVGAAVLLGVPVLVLARRTFAGLPERSAAWLHAVGATLLGVLGGALALNTVLPWAGVDRPLDRPVLVAASTLVDVALLLHRPRAALLRRDEVTTLLRAVVRARLEPAVTLAVTSVVLAVAGAVRLNNGLGGGVAVAAHAAAVLAVGLGVARRGALRRDVVVTYAASLALLLGTSLRGWFITGHDIQNEYLAFLYTHHADHWVMSTYAQPYNACLSVNLLPHVLVEQLGVSGLVAFKVLLQAVFALVPVAVLVAARRISRPRVAQLAVAFVVFFPTFYTDMPFLVRQEIAYLFVALLLLAVAQPGWSLRTRRVAVVVLGVGVVLSHYSTTYVLVMTLVLGALGVVAGAVARRVRGRRAPRRTNRPLVLLQPVVVLAIALSAWAWSSPLTHSAGHLADTVEQLTSAIMSGDAQAGSSDLGNSILPGSGGPTPQQRWASYVDEAAEAREGRDPSGYVFPSPTGRVRQPALAEQTDLPLTPAGRALERTGLPVPTLTALTRFASGAVFQLLLVVGLVLLLVRARATRRIDREHFWLMAAGVGALGAVVVVPGLSADYGVLRAFQQTLLVTAPLLALALAGAFGRLRRTGTVLAAAIAAVVGLVLTGALPAVVGGYGAVLSQSNAGPYYDTLYVRSPQLAAGRWLAVHLDGESIEQVAAPDVVGMTRLQMVLPRNVAVNTEYLPLQLRRGEYVVLGAQQVDRGESTVFWTGDSLTYRYPVDAVDARMDLVYSTGSTRVYK